MTLIKRKEKPERNKIIIFSLMKILAKQMKKCTQLFLQLKRKLYRHSERVCIMTRLISVRVCTHILHQRDIKRSHSHVILQRELISKELTTSHMRSSYGPKDITSHRRSLFKLIDITSRRRLFNLTDITSRGRSSSKPKDYTGHRRSSSKLKDLTNLMRS